jgi:hypothetical protein
MRHILFFTLLFVLLMSCSTTEEAARPAERKPVQPPPVDAGLPMLRPLFVMEVDLPEPFYKRVDLRRLRVGMTKEEVLAIFPDPLEIDIRQTGYEMWAYDEVELYFRDGTLRDWFNL